jgi:hypothetical protein
VLDPSSTIAPDSSPPLVETLPVPTSFTEQPENNGSSASVDTRHTFLNMNCGWPKEGNVPRQSRRRLVMAQIGQDGRYSAIVKM